MNTTKRIMLTAAASLLLLAGCSKIWGSGDNTEARKERLENPEAMAAADPDTLTPEELAIRDARRERDDELRSIGSQIDQNYARRDQKPSPFDDEIRGPIFVEVLWKVPKEEVFAFHLHYGLAPDSLNKNVRIPVEKLERVSHPLYGPTYRYRLYGMSPEQTTYVSLQAENQNGISPRSPVLKIPAINKLRSQDAR